MKIESNINDNKTLKEALTMRNKQVGHINTLAFALMLSISESLKSISENRHTNHSGCGFIYFTIKNNNKSASL